MRMKLVDVSPLSWIVSEQVRSARGSWNEREGVKLTFEDEAGRIGYGEASPLPGYSRETLADCWGVLSKLRGTTWSVGVEPEKALRMLRSNGTDQELAALRFALEMGYFDLLSQRLTADALALAPSQFRPLLLRSEPVGIPVAALLENSSVEACVRSAKRAMSSGISTFKLKLGREACWDLELTQLQALRDTFGDSVRLRADANQHLGEPLAEKLHVLGKFKLDFIEEPCDSLASLEESYPPGAATIALDESLQALDPDMLTTDPPAARSLRSLIERGAVGALVLKPMALGGLARCLKWAHFAHQAQLKVIVSHLFSGPIASRWEKRLAASIGTPTEAQGLHYQPTHSAP
ncbi:MAG: enolase C-terminal domain-like protein [Polyangiaceae bacterium]|nr:enolase C-terminal domain-like protein [Polyangiaceae bacterium]